MKKLLLVIIYATITMAAFCQSKKVAIVEIVDKEDKISYPVEVMVRSNLTKAITNKDGYAAYDRTDIASITGEQNFQRTGMVSDVSIKKLGNLTGADYILISEVVLFDENNIFVTAKVLNVETARTDMVDNELMGTTANEIQEGCIILANKLLGSIQPSNGTTKNNKEFTVNGVTFEMIFVQGGTFQMGATYEQGSSAENTEKPITKVTLNDYYIGKFEVTQLLWTAVMGTNPSNNIGINYPVEKVSWNECQEFIMKLNQLLSLQLDGKKFSLPTEKQWEFASRGGNQSHGYKYSGSNTLADVAWYCKNSDNKTHAVGSKEPNELGIFDMSGNVWEWCNDWYLDYYDKSIKVSTTRSFRGGSFISIDDFCRVSKRNHKTPTNSSRTLGFRLILQ